jgi:hypothetical protein
MDDKPDWLPDPLTIERYNSEVLEDVYRRFCRDLVRNCCRYGGVSVFIANRDLLKGKERTFWHLISTGESDLDREIDLDRCRHLNWIRPIIENSADSRVLKWTVIQRRTERTKLWLREAGFLIILDRGRNSYRIVTGYPITSTKTKMKLVREYEAAAKNQKPPS